MRGGGSALRRIYRPLWRRRMCGGCRWMTAPVGTLMLSLRLAEGLTPVLAARYGQDYAALLRRAEPLQKAGLLRADEERIALTDRGFLLSNSMIVALLG